jgi:flagellar hook-basal body complex protein FliE
MTINTDLNIAKATGVGSPVKTGAAGEAGGTSFSDMLKNSIDEVTKLQKDASKAVEDLVTGKTEDVTGVMTAMEKSGLAFKTLLAIRAKLMDAYEEIKQISV